MIRIPNLEEIQHQMLKIPSLIGEMKERNTYFSQNVKDWLEELEGILGRNRIFEASTIATLKGGILAVERGMEPVGINFRRKPTKRIAVESTAEEALGKATEIISEVIREHRTRIEQAEGIARQIIALAKNNGIDLKLPPDINSTARLKKIWFKLTSDPNIRQGTTQIEGLVGPHDVLIILDRVITMDGY